MAAKESKEDVAAVKQEVHEATSVDWNNVYAKLTGGTVKQAASSAPKSANAPIASESEGFSMSVDGLAAKYANKSVQNGPDISPIIYELNHYKFSSVHPQKDVEETAQVIRKALRARKASKIAKNTKELAKYAEKFFITDNGMQSHYTYLGHKYSMSVNGEFTGEEYLYLTSQNNSIVGLVLTKDDNGEFSDITSKFEVKIKRTT